MDRRKKERKAKMAKHINLYPRANSAAKSRRSIHEKIISEKFVEKKKAPNYIIHLFSIILNKHISPTI
jgi:hypothetical protein